MRYIIMVVSALLVAGSASAQSWRSENSETGGFAMSTLGDGERVYYAFDDATDSKIITVTAEEVYCMFDPNTASSGAATAQVKLMLSADDATGTGSANTSFAIGNTTLTGAAGAEVIYEIPGSATLLWVDVTTSAGGDSAVVTCVGTR